MAASPMAPSVSTVERSNSWNRSIATRESSSLCLQRQRKQKKGTAAFQLNITISKQESIPKVRYFLKWGLMWEDLVKISAVKRWLITVKHNLNFNRPYFFHTLDSKTFQSAVEMQYLTVMTLSTSFFASWKVLTPRERSIRSEKRQKINIRSVTAGEKSWSHMCRY